MKQISFQNPVKIEFGEGSRHKVGEIICQCYKKALVMVGKGIPDIYYNELKANLEKSGITVFETEKVDSNPRVSTVRNAAKLCREEKIDAVVALGGGSALDCAKMTAVCAATGGDVCSFLWGDIQPITKSLPVVTIPTIAATGTELNNTAVIRNEETKQKSSCAAGCMYPVYSFIDPEYARELPYKTALWGAMDVLSHTFEYYFNGYNSPFQLRFSEGIILAAIDCISQLSKGYSNFYYGELMWTAAMTWGTGLTRIGRGLPDMACHTIEEGIGAYFDTHHGAGLGILTPVWMRYVYKKSPDIFARFARNIWGVSEADNVIAAEKGIICFENWLKELGVETSYRQLLKSEISDDILKTLSNDIFKSSNKIVGRLVPLSENDVFEILKLSTR